MVWFWIPEGDAEDFNTALASHRVILKAWPIFTLRSELPALARKPPVFASSGQESERISLTGCTRINITGQCILLNSKTSTFAKFQVAFRNWSINQSGDPTRSRNKRLFSLDDIPANTNRIPATSAHVFAMMTDEDAWLRSRMTRLKARLSSGRYHGDREALPGGCCGELEVQPGRNVP